MDADVVDDCALRGIAVVLRANREEEEHDRFFQDRYRATRLADEASLLACAAYADLNPIAFFLRCRSMNRPTRSGP